jgi:hypothetical protein
MLARDNGTGSKAEVLRKSVVKDCREWGVGNEFAHRKDWALWILSRGNGCMSSSPLTTCLIPSKRTPTRIPIPISWLIRGGSLLLQNQHRLLANICPTLPDPTTKQHQMPCWRLEDLRYLIPLQYRRTSTHQRPRRPTCHRAVLFTNDIE